MEKQDHRGADSSKSNSVVPDYCRGRGIPEEEIPALVALVYQVPVSERAAQMIRVANEWCVAHGRGAASSADHLPFRPELLAHVLAQIRARRPLSPVEAQALEVIEGKGRGFVALLRDYDPQSRRPMIADKGMGHILHVGHTCEQVLVELLQCAFRGADSAAKEAAMQSKLDELPSQLAEAVISADEQRVLEIAAGAPFGICGRTWTSGHNCLFDLARDFLSEPSTLVRLLTAKDVQFLLNQLAIERTKITSGDQVAQQPLALIRAIQGVQDPASEPSSLDGRVPGGSPEAKRKAAAKKGAVTKASKKEKAAEAAEAERAAAQKRRPRSPETKDWMAWLLKTGKVTIRDAGGGKFECTYTRHAPGSTPTDAQAAATLSFMLSETVAQQRVGEMRKKVDEWMGMSLPVPDFSKLFSGQQQELDLGALDKLIIDAAKTFPVPRNDHDAQMTADQQDGAYSAGEEDQD